MQLSISRLLPTFAIATHLLTAAGLAAAEPVEVGSIRQLFIDRHLIDRLDGARLVLHRPVRREVAIAAEHPWEKHGVSYMTTFRDDDKFRAWYRCDAAPLDGDRRRLTTAYAESPDGVEWTKPKLGLVEFDGSKENNLVWAGPGVNMAVFKDGNPDCPAEERYKAIVRDGSIYGLVSPDGLHWKRLKQPLLTRGPFDSHNIAFWDEANQQYVAYMRGVRREGELGHAMSRSFKGGVRDVRRATSEDFRRWSEPELIDLGDAPLEHLYTSSCVQYPRAKGLYLAFPSRYVNTRRPDPDWKHQGVNDVVLLSSRDGKGFDRTFPEAFVRPGPDQDNWHDRSLYMERGILQTAPAELSLFAMEHWRLPSVHIRRLTIRPDGFASVQGPYSGGELVTKPLRCTGDVLRLNFSTSAVGSVQVEIQDEEGDPLDGFSLAECPEIYGDRLEQPVHWKSGADLDRLEGQAVRLRFVLRDADLYAFRFGESGRSAADR